MKVRLRSPEKIFEEMKILQFMRKDGCKQLKFGVVSGDPNILKLMNKNISIMEIIIAFKLTKEASVKRWGIFYYRILPTLGRR